MRAHVRRGRLVVDEPTEPPEGSEVALEIVDHDVLAEEFSPEARARLEASIETARAQAERGEGIDGAAYLMSLRARLRALDRTLTDREQEPRGRARADLHISSAW